MTTTILANWKSNKTKDEAKHWLETFLDHYTPRDHLNILIAPPALYLGRLKQILDSRDSRGVSLVAQNISPFPAGSYTGEVSASMVKDYVDFVLVGHAERRQYFHESHQEVARKVEEAQAVDLTPILCVDLPYARAQFAALDQHTLNQDLLIGFGPVDAVNLDIPHLAEDQQANIRKIQQMADQHPILYGGSVRPENGQDYLNLQGISGLMVGSACIDPQEFAGLCNSIIP